MIRGNRGVAVILIVLGLAALIAGFLVAVNNSLITVNKNSRSVKITGDILANVTDLSQVLYSGYMLAKDASIPCPTIPTPYTRLKIDGPPVYYICMPTAALQCSKQNSLYCLKNPYELVRNFDHADLFVASQNHQRSVKKMNAFFAKMILPLASAQSAPEPWMPTLAGEPSVTIDIPNCNINTPGCLRCGGATPNALCLTFTVCLNGQNTCPAEGTYIKPTIAFQTGF